ncbi:hypothetical protein NDU88_003538 [Pleurodeles waltl]|uniref:Uncharacterized protein n=1 Tax=Pleurodeles waltl TaxID=8319 RepID=A0AAV7W5L5_PLEWA|nr:hypothetical protein NDU88_003538 [Pleurodeles waltl]
MLAVRVQRRHHHLSGRPSFAAHAWPAWPHHLASLLQDLGAVAPGARLPSFPPVVVLAGGASPRGACPPGIEDPVTPRASRPRSLTDPAPLNFRLAVIGRVSLTEDPEGGGPSRRVSAASAVSAQQRPFRILRPGPEHRAVPLQGVVRPTGRPLSSLLAFHGTSALRARANRFQ